MVVSSGNGVAKGGADGLDLLVGLGGVDAAGRGRRVGGGAGRRRGDKKGRVGPKNMVLSVGGGGGISGLIEKRGGIPDVQGPPVGEEDGDDLTLGVDADLPVGEEARPSHGVATCPAEQSYVSALVTPAPPVRR